jgi:hypothetical protein
MDANQLWTDDGEKRIDNEGVMKIITEEYQKFQFQAELKSSTKAMNRALILYSLRKGNTSIEPHGAQ